MTENKLSFGDWVENSVYISSNSEGSIKVFSLQNTRLFYESNIISSYNGESVLNDLKKGQKSEILHKIYTSNYNWIQAQYKISLN